MKHFTKLFACFCFTLMLSCYPEGPEYVDELDLVVTNYFEDYDFSSQSTYALPDSVVEITDDLFNGDEDDDPDFVDPVYGDVILAQIRENMNNMGYTEVDEDDDPDVILLPSVNTTTNVYYYYDWWYWDWYYPGWTPGWGWWYPGWYYPPTIGGYRSGSLFIQMTDPDEAVNDNIMVAWNAIINGLLQGSTASVNQRLQVTIDQAFEQSPYLAQ